ncbi:GGDEF domain-containing protein [Zavarzinia sp.]|uniref:GGDEF domain-containing protein n=1 Tax=Zavarzinia sp. TaxID=2027920 RepID=UPI00356869F0
MSKGESGHPAGPRGRARPIYAGVISALFALAMTIGTLMLVSAIIQQASRFDIARLVLMFQGTAEPSAMPVQVDLMDMFEVRRAETPMPSEDVDGCRAELTRWFGREMPIDSRDDIKPIARAVCSGEGRAVVGLQASNAMAMMTVTRNGAGAPTVAGLLVRMGRFDILGILRRNPLIYLLVAAVTLSAGGFAYYLRLQPYHLYVDATARATTDGLSGVLRREEFLAGLERKMSEIAADGGLASVLALDLDHFKAVNDKFGHAAGDEVIHVCGEIIGSTVRGGDLVGRVGGEEFMVLLPNLPKFVAAEVADRLRKKMAAHAFDFDGQRIFVTVSIGVASVMPRDTSAAVMSRADYRLYMAKNGGRNCVVWEDDDNHDF